MRFCRVGFFQRVPFGCGGLHRKGKPGQPQQVLRRFSCTLRRAEKVLRINKGLHTAGRARGIRRHQPCPVHLPQQTRQAQNEAQKDHPPQHPCSRVPAAGRKLSPGPEQQRQHAEQRHGAEFLPADGVCLQDSTGKLRQQPKRQRGHPCQPERLRPLPECARKQDQRRQNSRAQQPGQQCRAHRTSRGRGVCQRGREHAEAQCRARKNLFLFHAALHLRSCQILQPCRDRRR